MVRIQPGRKLLERRIQAVKEALDLSLVAQALVRERDGVLTQQGERWRGMCPLCGNGGRSQAFSCDARLFHCFSCGEGGDVVRLAERVLDMPCAMAVSWLAHTYAIELPGRPDSWYAKQDRQLRTRRELVERRENLLRRRLFRLYMVPLLNATGATEDEVKAAWQDFKDIGVEGLVRVGSETPERSEDGAS